MTVSDMLIWPATVVAAAIACGLWRPVAARLGFIDRPGNRSLHDRPMARAAGFPAGVALAGVLLLWGEDFPFLLNAALLTAAGLMLLSTLDDRMPLPVIPRLGMHLLACFGFVGLVVMPATPLGPALQIAAVVVLGLALAWMTNLYNFMDGSDGLAGGQAVIGFLALAAIADLHGVAFLALAALAISGAAAGFLVWNAPPARIFLGDAGSIPLGFLAGALALLLVRVSEASPWLVMLPFAPFWLDASVTLARRILRGERFWEPHREHCYQALVRSGLGHGRTALVAYTLMLICSLVAVVGSRWATLAWELVLVGGCLAMLTGVGVWSVRRLHPVGGGGRTG